VPRADDDPDVFSYSYIEIGATELNVEDGMLDDEAETYFAEGSLELFEFLNIFLGYENQSFDVDNADTDIWTLGAGVHFSVLPQLDLTADLAWLLNSLDSDNFDEDTDAFQGRIGARWMLMHRESFGLEAFGRVVGISRDDIEGLTDDETLVGFDVGLRVHFLDHFSIAGEYSDLEDNDQLGLSARFSF
jgi:hypothetical protein